MKTGSTKAPSLAQLFTSTLTISACTFGGGFVIASLMKKDFVDKHHWMEDSEMMDFVAIAQSCPGAIAVNTAILSGYQMRGVPGIAVAVCATILPPLVILLLVSVFYNAFASSTVLALLLKGMQAGIAAVILDVVLSLGETVIQKGGVVDVAVMILAFAACWFLKLSATWIILTILLFGIVRVLIQNGSKKEASK